MRVDKKMLVLLIQDGDKEVPVAIYPNGLDHSLLDEHLKIACQRGLPAWRYRLVPLPSLYQDGVLYVPKGQNFPVSVEVREVKKPVFFL